MKILHTVEFYHPSVGGSQEVVRQLSERLVKLGHDVTVATTKLPNRTGLEHNGVKIVEFEVAGNLAHGITGETKRFQNFVLAGNWDVVMNYAAQQWATDLCYELLDKLKGRKVLVPCGFSGLGLPEYKEYFAQMPKIMKQYDATVYLSNSYRDVNFAREQGVDNCHVIPNGAGEDEFLADYPGDIRAELGIAGGEFMLLTVGSHSGLKGHDEAIHIFRKSSLKNAVLVINGNSYEGHTSCSLHERLAKLDPRIRLQSKRILQTNLARPSLVAAYRAADLFLFPSNIEASPLVLFEATAAELPFLTTDVGNAREIVDWTDGGEVMPTTIDSNGLSHANIEQSAKLLDKLYNDKDYCHKLADAGFTAWRQCFSWEVIVRQYEALYNGSPL